jgi:hypothetical protein
MRDIRNCTKEFLHVRERYIASKDAGNVAVEGSIPGGKTKRTPEEVIAHGCATSETFRELWAGRVPPSCTGDRSQSGLDMFFANALAIAAEGDRKAMYAVLKKWTCYRDKWEANGGYYRRITVNKALQFWHTTTPEYDFKPAPGGSAALRALSKVEPRKLEFLINPQIPLQEMIGVAGPGNVGKTQLVLLLVRCLADGARLPWEDKLTPAREPMKIIYLSRENDAATSTLPRLLKMGLENRSNVFVHAEGTAFSSLTDGTLERLIQEHGVGFVVIDPYQSYTDAGDVNRVQDVRQELDALGDMFKRHNCTAVIIFHFNKKEDSDMMFRVIGSIDLVNKMRSFLLVGRNPKDPDQIVVIHAKHNDSRKGDALAFRIDPNGRFYYEGISGLTDFNLHKDRAAQKGDEALDIVREVVWRQGWAYRSEIDREAFLAGVSEATFARALAESGFERVREKKRGGRTIYYDPLITTPEDFRHLDEISKKDRGG